MIAVKLSYIVAQLGWRLLGPDRVIESVITDSRQVTTGDCFVALYGETFDAHQFIDQVIKQGASTIIVNAEQDVAASDVSQLIVKDTRVALGQLAALNRQLCDAKFIAITGSCGKTTVKEMVAAILSNRGQVLATAGNFNNDIGVPLTLLRLTKDCDFGVIELGANHVGEIDYTSSLVQPDVSLITNIGAAHLEGFGGIAGVVKAKTEIFNHLSAQGEAIFDQASEHASSWQQLNVKRQITTFTTEAGENSSLYATDLSFNAAGKARFTLNSPLGQQWVELALPGQHNVGNALAAAAACLAVGASLSDIALGLESMQDVAGRLNFSALSPLVTVIDDTYNANSSSIAAAVKLLGRRQGYKILVLADMAELGDYAVECHKELGPVIEQQQIDLLLTIGQFSQHYASTFSGQHYHFEDKNSLNLHIEQQLHSHQSINTTVLVKGSRSAKMEQVVAQIKIAYSTLGEQSQC
ncbi:MAG: UDP-N-acetylmuramoyl-tripeptide--D-alanyl-D-alanine ligase [Gammaproteobacteria bacterium]|nr:UDP-N-acetylmuramoyl-tripeptide--D-alanyl-D-alanine ligase [Gammaproteobacteria bacterium]